MANISTKKLVLGMILLGALFFVGSYVLALMSDKKTSLPNTVSTPSNPQSNETTTNQPSKDVVIPKAPVFSGKQVINLTPNGFDPATITIKAGTLIQWINKSGANATVSSNDHPTHKLYSPLNLGLFGNNSGVSLIFDAPGTYKYHDHLRAERKGTVIVEP